MKLVFPRSIEKLALADYMPAFGDQVLQVWVNPPMGVRVAYLKALRDAAEQATDETTWKVYTQTAELLSQGPEDSHWTAEEIREMIAESAVTDPRFWPWLVQQIVTLIEQHRGNIKKN